MLKLTPDICVILYGALDLKSAEEQSRYLDAACGTDTDLRAGVARLLKAHQVAGDFLGGASTAERPAINNSPAPEHAGATIGRYKLLEQIGDGGMGVVFMAEQRSPVRRKVALKIIKPGMDSRQVIARFEAERQALAMMDHPNIARVFDAGTTDSGHPYFVMELVRGIPITDFCDRNNLRTKERLKLVVEACHAVQHAHHKGIIHRDIKPTNILVTLFDGKPVPKIIDFGIAKATQQPLTERTFYTGFRQFIGTPQYMSPEQAELSGQDVDTRSDIYSLGVLLYELLVGTTPLDPALLRRTGYDQLCQVIRDTEPATPSKRISTLGDAVEEISRHHQTQPATLAKMLRGDLDWIVMKALEKDRTRRYETADALALDIERHLNDEPVRARPPSTAYRLKKFVRKHRAPVATTAVVLAALMVGVIMALTGLVRARQDRRIAISEKTRADQTATDLRRELYVSDLNSAYNAWQDGITERARAILYRHVPQPGAEDLRGFEWHYLWGQYQRTQNSPTFRQDWPYLLALSPDGTILASGSRQNTVRLWNIATQSEIHTLVHGKGITGIAFSPDGRLLATSSRDGAARLWDVGTGKLCLMLPHADAVTAVAFSSDGQTLATGCDAAGEAEIKLWNIAAHAELATLVGHTEKVTVLAFSPDGCQLASGSVDRTVRLWDTKARRELDTLRGHGRRVDALAFSPDGAILASADLDDRVRLWDMATRQPVAELSKPMTGASFLAFSPNGDTLAMGSKDTRVWLWDLCTKRFRVHYTGHSAAVEAAVFLPSGNKLVSCSSDGTIRVAEVYPLAAEHPGRDRSDWLTSVAICPTKGNILAVGTSDDFIGSRCLGDVVLWDIGARSSRVLTDASDWPVCCVAISPDGQILAAGEARHPEATSCHVTLWDIPTGRILHTLEGHRTSVASVAFSPCGSTLVSGEWGSANLHKSNAQVRWWDVRTGKQQREPLTMEGFALTCIQYSPDGKTLAIAGGTWADGRIVLLDAATGRKRTCLTAHPELVGDVAFSSDSKTLAAADWSGAVMLWDVASHHRQAALEAHSYRLTALAFSPDDRTLASAGFDGTVRLWHVATGGALATLKVHTQVSSLAFFPDGKTLAAGCTDRTVKLWNVEAGEELLIHD